MAIEQPQTPSAEPKAADDVASEPSSVESEKQSSSKTPGWWQNLFHRRGDPEPESSDADSSEDGKPSAIQLTQEELDRRVQAETDRREAKRASDERAKRRRELRDTDPWQYAKEEREEEVATQGNGQIQKFLADVGTEHDKVAIDPIFLALPKGEQERIRSIEGAGIGLAGRKLVVTEALKTLEKQWKAEGAKDAENKLRRNQAFRKQILAESRGQTVEPDLLPAVSGTEADQTVSALLRKHYHLG